MADKIPLKAIFTGTDVTALGEMAAGETVPVANGGTGAVDAAGARASLFVPYQLSLTSAVRISAGTTAQRNGSPQAGDFRINTDISRFEGYNGTAWGSLGGATGGGNDAVFYLNDQVVNNDYTIPTGQNAGTWGPITIAAGKTVTSSAGTTWTVAGPINGGANTRVTGEFCFFMLPAAPAGWIAGDGGTIGNIASGATRANADTLALFTAWWAYTDAQLPIFTSAGGASTRGVSAAADWAANKRLTVFDVRGRFPRAAGTINSLTFVNGTKYADSIKDHAHALSVWNSGSGGGGAPLSSNNTSAAGAQTTGSISPTGATETAPVSIGMLGCFKL